MGTTYGEHFTRNLRAARARAGIDQRLTAERMQALGYASWTHSKVSKCERGVTPVMVSELFALAATLECTMVELLGANPSDGEIEFANGDTVGAVSVRNSAYGMQDHAVTWDGASPSITRPATPYSAQAWDRTLMSA